VPLQRGDQQGGVIVTPPDDGGPIIRPVIIDPGAYTPVWVAPDPGKTVLQLNPDSTVGAERFTIRRGVAGLGYAPVDLVTTAALGGGVTVDFVRRNAQTILWPLRIRGATHMEFLTEWRRVADLFAMTSDYGPGVFRIRRPDGTEREAVAWYAGGLEQEPDEGAWLTLTPVVKLLVPSGLWRTPTRTEFSATQETSADYLAPYPSIGSGTVIGASKLRNDGVADAWPEWEIRGPMTQLTATNITRGQSFTLTYALGVGEVARLASRPLVVTGPAGQNLKGSLNLLAGGKPWRLSRRTINDVQFTVAGAASETTPGADNGTRIVLRYYQHHGMS
jgi:hypothetical protein